MSPPKELPGSRAAFAEWLRELAASVERSEVPCGVVVIARDDFVEVRSFCPPELCTEAHLRMVNGAAVEGVPLLMHSTAARLGFIESATPEEIAAAKKEAN